LLGGIVAPNKKRKQYVCAICTGTGHNASTCTFRETGTDRSTNLKSGRQETQETQDFYKSDTDSSDDELLKSVLGKPVIAIIQPNEEEIVNVEQENDSDTTNNYVLQSVLKRPVTKIKWLSLETVNLMQKKKANQKGYGKKYCQNWNNNHLTTEFILPSGQGMVKQ
jgi:hypothetical protein